MRVPVLLPISLVRSILPRSFPSALYRPSALGEIEAARVHRNRAADGVDLGAHRFLSKEVLEMMVRGVRWLEDGRAYGWRRIGRHERTAGREGVRRERVPVYSFSCLAFGSDVSCLRGLEVELISLETTDQQNPPPLLSRRVRKSSIGSNHRPFWYFLPHSQTCPLKKTGHLQCFGVRPRKKLKRQGQVEEGGWGGR